MSGILEIIFQGFLEWAYTLILEIWEFFSTALLNIMSMDFAYLQSRIPILPVLQQSFLAVGWALLIGNLVFQSVRSMLSGLGFDAEDPKLLFSRTFVFSFLLVASPQICGIALNMTAAVIRMMEMPNAVAITTLSESAFAGLGTAWLLVIICGVVVMYQSVKLFVEMAERYFILCMLTITSPMAFGLGGSRSTSDIFSHWCRMYGSMCLLMVMNVVFIKILMSVLAYSPTGPDVLPWMVLVMAVVRTAKKFDSIVSRLGLNPAITNEPRVPGMLSLMVARTMMSNAAKVISQNGAQGAGRSGGSGPPPSGTGNGHGSGGENRNDRRDFNSNRNADKGGQRNPGEERDRRGRNRNGGSPPPDGAPSSGGRGGGQRGSNPGGSNAKRGSGGGQNRDAASSGAKKKDGGQRETNGGGQGYRRNSGESGGAQRNRSYRNPNAPPDSPPESGRDASRRSSQESGRQSSSGQFDGRRSSPQTSFTRNGDGVSSNGGGQSPREQGFTESGRRDTGKTSAPRNGQPSPVRSETRAPVSRTAADNPAERASSGTAPKKGGSDGGHGADGQSTRHSERPQEKASRQTPGGSPTPLSSSRTRTDSDSHSGVTQSRAERTSATTRADVSSKESGRTSVTDSRFTQRGESAAQGKAKDGAVTPQSDAAHTPPHTPPETPPRNVTSPVTQEKASPDRESASGSGETRFSNRSASSSTTTTTASSTANKSGAESRKVPTPDEKPSFSSADTRFTNRPSSPTTNAADSAQSYVTEGRTDSPTPRNVTAPAPRGTVTLHKDKETASGSEDTRFTNRAASQTSMSASGVTSKSAASSDKETASNAEETRFSNRTAAQTPAAASGVTSGKEATSNAEETRFSNRTASQMSTAINGATPNGSVSSDKKEAGSNSGDTRFSNRAASQNAASVSQTSAVTGGVTTRSVSPSDKETASNPEETRFFNRTVSQTSVTVNGTASKSVIPADKKETGSNSGESRFTNRPVPSDTVSAPPAVANGVNAQGGSSKPSKETDSASRETRFTSRPASGNAVPAPPASSTVSAASSKGTEATRYSGDSRFINRAAPSDASLPPQTSTATGGGTAKGVPSPDRNADSTSGETRFSNRAAPSDNASAPPAPTAASGATAKVIPSPDRNADSASEETRFTSRSVSGNAVSATPTPTATGGGTSKTVPSPGGETASDSGDSRFTSRPASPVAASRTPVAADGGTSPDRFSAASNRTPEHMGVTENRSAVAKPDNAGTPDAKPGAQVVISQTGAPPSHVVSSGKADGGVTTESRFSQRDSAKMAEQSHTAASIPVPLPTADNSRGGVTDGASAHDTKQSAREPQERVPAVTPSDSAKSAPARPERGETSGQSVIATATPGRASSAVPRPPMSGGGSEQNATRRSEREPAGQNNGRPDNGASETSAAAKADATLSHPATVPPRVGGGNRETPTRPDRPGTEKRSATVSETPAPRQQTSRSDADASGKTLNPGERRGSARQPGESANAVSQRLPAFDNNAAPPRPVTRETAAGYGETQRQPHRNADVPPPPATLSGASGQRENPTRRGEQPTRKMYASDNGAPTRPNAERTERRADQFGERPQTSGQRSYPPNREQRTSQPVRDSDNHSVPVRSATGTANRADSARQRTQDSSERRPVSPDTATEQRPGRSNKTRTPPGMYAPDNASPARPGRNTAESNDARRPAGQPQRNANTMPHPDGRRPLQQQGEERTPDTRSAEGHGRVPILSGAAGKRDSATRPNLGRGKSAVPPPGRYYDAEWRSVPARRENGAPRPPQRNGKEASRSGAERKQTETPSEHQAPPASEREKRPLFNFFGFGDGKRK